MDVKKEVKKLENCRVQVDVEVEAEEWKAAQDKAFKKISANLEVDGFRKGKAPAAIAKKHIDLAKLYDEAINIVLPNVYRQIIEEEKLEPYAQPVVDVTKVGDNELGVKFIVITRPEVELGQYKDLKIGKEEVKVEDKDVDDSINSLLVQNASLIVKEGAAELGDTVVMDFAGTVNKEAFEGGSAQNYELELGSHSFIPGFEEQLVGLKAGEHKDVNVTFPEQYTADLAGKDAVFACDVHEVKSKKLPELNDEFVKDLGIKDVETVEALRANKKEELLKEKEKTSRNNYLNKLYETIRDNSKISIPEEMVKEQANASKKNMEQRIMQSGLTLEQYLQFVGQKEEDFVAKLAEDAKIDIANYFILMEVAQKEGLEVTDADIEFEMAKLAEQYNMTLDDVKKVLSPQMNDFRHNVEMTRIEQFLFDNNK